MGVFTLLIIIVNFYSYMTFTYFSNRYYIDSIDIDGEGRETEIKEMICNSPYHCLLAFLHYGLRGGEGMAGLGKNIYFEDEKIYLITFVFDFTYMLVISLTLLNIINGIIIDAFADLRD
jgi:inositol 1,4,5-triphosphate receptor type 3